MEALSKIEVIDLINNINIDGVDNTSYTLSPVISTKDSTAVFGGEEGMGVTLSPGAYLAVWSSEPDFSDIPRIRDYADKLGDEKFELVPDDDKNIVIFLLDRLGA